MPELIQERVKELFSYNQQSGELVRIGGGRNSKYNYSNWSRVAGYKQVWVDGRTYLVHRLIWLYVHGAFPTEIDHINGNRIDNRISNLRDVTKKENAKNSAKRRDNTSGVTGVCWHKSLKKWFARINAEESPLSLGYFDNFGDAVIARKKAEKEYGYHENHGR